MAIYDNNMMSACAKAQAQVPMTAGEVLSTVNETDVAISCLSGTLDQLFERLGSVIGPDVPKGIANDQADRDASCPLEGRLMEQRDRIRTMTQVAQGYMSRIKL